MSFLKLQGPNCHFRNLRGHFCKYFGTKNVRNLGPGGKNVILTKVRGQKWNISGRWSDQPWISATSSATLGPARPGAERHLVEHLACDQNVPYLQIAIPASFLNQFRRGLFLCARNHEGNKSPKAISWKRTRKFTDLKMAAIGGGCDGVGPDSGVVRPCSWSGFGRGSEGVRMVCLIPTEVAGFVGFEGGGGGRRWKVVRGVFRRSESVFAKINLGVLIGESRWT